MGPRAIGNGPREPLTNRLAAALFREVYHLVGDAGGITHFLEHLSDSITTWWGDLGTPSFAPDVDRTLIDELRAIQGSHSMEALAAKRDRLLVELLDARHRSFLP